MKNFFGSLVATGQHLPVTVMMARPVKINSCL